MSMMTANGEKIIQVAVHQKVYDKLMQKKAQLIARTGKNVSFNEVLSDLLKGAQ